MKLSILFALSTVFAAAEAIAGTTVCSSADQRVSTAASFPDGGAPFEPTYRIALDGITLFERDVFSGADVQDADYAVTDETEISFEPMTKDQPQTRVFAARLDLQSRATGATLFSDFMLCKTVSRPCPLCP